MVPVKLRATTYSEEPDQTKLLQQSLIYGKALEVARKGNQDFRTYEIVMKYLHLAEEEIDKYIYDKNNDRKSNSLAQVPTDNDCQSEKVKLYMQTGMGHQVHVLV